MRLSCLRHSIIVLSPKGLLILLLLVGAIRALTLGSYPIFDSTESRYAEIPREMLATGNWITPQLDPSDPFWGKPPLSFWITAISFQALGVSEVSARLPHLLVSFMTVALTWAVGARIFGRANGLLAALILATTGLFHSLAAGVMTDPTLTTCVTLSLCGFALALYEPSGWRRTVWGYAFFAGAALSLLAKGPVGLLLILLPVALWVALTRRWSAVAKGLPWLGGTVVALAIAVPWYVLAEIRTPGFWDYFIIGEHVRRFLVPGWEGDLYGNPHEHTRGFIWLYGAVSTLPWGLYLALFLIDRRREKGALRAFFGEPWRLFFLLWFLSPLLLFTLAGNIIITYTLPGVPGFALLCAQMLPAIGRAPASSGRAPLASHPTGQWASALAAPVCFFIAAVAILPFVGARRSHKQMIEAFQAARPDDGARLMYYDQMPYSADLYSLGVAEMVSEDDRAQWARIAGDKTQDYIVVRERDLSELRAVTNIPLRILHRHGRFLLVTDQ